MHATADFGDSIKSDMFQVGLIDRHVASRTPVLTCVHIVRESKKNMTHQKKKQQVSRLAQSTCTCALSSLLFMLCCIKRRKSRIQMQI